MTSVDKLPSAKQSITRDRWGRPLIIPPDGGKPVAYRRVTTIAGAIEERFALEMWAKRMVAQGLAERPDLLKRVSIADNDRELNTIAEEALEQAKGSDAKRKGTATHLLLERYDKELPDLPEGNSKQDLKDRALIELLTETEREQAKEAWQRFLASTGWTIDGVEVFVVQDDIKAAGTLDRILSGHIADLKTGASADYGHQAWAAQLAIYARSKRYVDGVRTPLNVDLKVGYILHLPVGAKDVTVYDIDLERGRQIAKVAMSVIEWRATKDLMRRHDPWGVPRAKP